MRMKRRRKNKLVLKRYAFILGVLMCITAFITSLVSEFDVYANNNIKTSESFDEANGIKYLKTATPTDKEGEYEITFKIKGTPTTEIIPSDIIMVMDTSGSMKNDMRTLKTSMNKFVDEVLKIKDTRVSVIEFAGPSDFRTEGKSSDAKVIQEFSQDAETIKSKIQATTAGGGTNAQAAWQAVGTQLDKARKGSKQYVVFFTDGIPTVKNGIKSVDSTEVDKIRNQIKPDTINAYNEVIKDKSVKVYSIGLLDNIKSYFPSITKKMRELAREILNETQNTGGTHFIEGGNSNLGSIYEEIANNIITDMSMATNTIITDEVTKEFDIIPNSNIQVIKPGVEGKEDEILNIQPTINGNKISFNLGNVGTEGRIIKFRIKLKDEYYGIGDEKIKTNVKATMNYKDKNNQNKEITFQVPEVNIPYKQGSITIEKEVINKDGLKAPKDDNFNILLNGNGNSYAFNLKGGESKKINFTLKHKDAKVSDENLAKQDFLNIGEFDIKEIVPMNYEIQSIIVNDKNVTDNPKVTINNSTTDIKIKITNKYVNDNYFYDKDEKKNVLKVGK